MSGQYEDFLTKAKVAQLEQRVAALEADTAVTKREIYAFMLARPKVVFGKKQPENVVEMPSRRSNVEAIQTMTRFIERFLAYDDLGQQVSGKVRDDARVALGRARVES